MRQGLVAGADQNLIQVRIGIDEPKLRCAARKGHVIMLRRKGHLAPENGIQLARCAAARMSEADLDRPDGRTGQGLTNPDERPGPELDLMTIGVPGYADIAVAEAQVTVFSALQPD